MYNWSKERSEKLVKQVTSLGAWLTSRSTFYTDVIMQKLGIFHHQPKFSSRQADQSGNSQFYPIDVESITKFPHSAHSDNKDWTRLSGRSQSKTSFPWNSSGNQIMRDAKPIIHRTYSNPDPVVKSVYELQDLRYREKKSKGICYSY